MSVCPLAEFTKLLSSGRFTQCLLNPVKMYIFSYIRKIYMFTSSPCTYEQCESVYTYLQESGKRDFLNNINKILKLLCEAIAWSSLPRDTFNMIYRQDKCVSTLYTGFILAQRIMKDLRITAQSLLPYLIQPLIDSGTSLTPFLTLTYRVSIQVMQS